MVDDGVGVGVALQVKQLVGHAALLALSLLASSGPAKAAAPALTFPVPSGVPNQLFYLQRDPNTNTVIYQLNVNSAGQLDEEEPIKIFWIRYAEQGQREELNFIQRKFAYGVKAKKLAPGKYELRFAAYGKLPLYLMRGGPDNAFHVYTTIASRQSVLERIYLRIEGGTFWVPNVKYVELKGSNPATRELVVGRFTV
ncbi:MAG: DUF4833 domain-containing protein [Cytophagaceae bacterium]|nr:MAG: DUF4833 domain-containing protein [Cytophagaceae bacterium]